MPLVISGNVVKGWRPNALSDGNVALPAISFNNSTTTGIYHAGNGVLGLAANGTSVMTLSNAGGVVVNGTVQSTASVGYSGGSLRVTGTTTYWTDGGVVFNRTPNGTDTTTWSIGRGYAQSDINVMTFMAPAGVGAKWVWTTLGTGSTVVHIDGDNLRLGIGKTPGTQLDLSTDSARKLTTTTWATGSDERIKEDIELANLDVCYETVKSIPLKRFAWKDSYAPADIQNDRRQLGFIAQDVETIMPKAVMQSAENGFDDFRTLNTDQLLKASWGALQRVMQKLEALEAQLSPS